MRPVPFLCSLVVLTHVAVVIPAQTTPAKAGQAPSPARGAILVELFTSEGCSDCPLADAHLREISNMHTPEGQLIVALSEHVTYWDRLGWKDSFSDPVFTARQNGYGYRFTLDSVYTPQMVVNGAAQFVGGNGKALTDALHAEAPRDRIDLRILSVAPAKPEPPSKGNHMDAATTTLSVRFSARNVSGAAPLEVMAAITDDLDETRVLSGENGGRTLTHASVARSLTRVGQIRGNATDTVRVALPAACAASPDKPRHLVLFVQQHNFGRVLGVDTRPL